MLWDNLVKGGHRPAPHHSLTYHLEHLAMAYDRAWEAYEPKPYEGRVLQICASRQPLGVRPDPTLGWSELLTGEFTIHNISGFRQNLLDEPAVESLASSIQGILKECENLNVLYDRKAEDSYSVSVRLADPGVVNDSSKISV